MWRPTWRGSTTASLWHQRQRCCEPLHLAHLQSVPFENLSIHLAEPIVLDPDLLVAKVVERLRGGFCYELSGAFAALLWALGFEVDLLAARVFDGERLGPLRPPGSAGAARRAVPRRCRFGDSFQVPLRLDTRTPQVDPAGRFLLVDAGGDLEGAGRPTASGCPCTASVPSRGL